MKDITVIYYTSNLEDEAFEDKIKKRLVESMGDLPLISVSRKPIDFGKNICVGEQKPSNFLLFTQLLTGCEAAETPFVINAESDFLYPPEYFQFVPPSLDKIYRYADIRLLWRWHWGYFRKEWSEGAQIAGREYLISVLKKELTLVPENYKHRLNPYRGMPVERFGGKLACITFKTGNSLHKYTGVVRAKSVPELPYWGTAEGLRKEMFYEN